MTASIHRRAGKTRFAIDWLLDHARESTEPHVRNYYLCPYRNQAKAVGWDMLCQLTDDDTGKRHASELYFEFANGNRVQLLGADGYDKHRGKYAHRVAFDETGQIAPGCWREVFRPMLADTKGEALFIGTPYGRNLFSQLWDLGNTDNPDWSSHSKNVYQTGIIEPDEIASLKAEMSHSEFEREFMVSWDQGAPGAYFQLEMEQANIDGRLVAGLLWEPLDLVHTSIALCAGDSIAVSYWQVDGRTPTLIDAKRYQQMRVDQVVRDIKAKPYILGSNVYSQHSGKRGTTRREIPFRLSAMRRLGLKGPLMPRREDFVDEVQITKMMLSRSRLSADDGIDAVDALRQVRASYDDATQTFGAYPVYDWSLDLATSINAFAEFERRGSTRRLSRRDAKERGRRPGSKERGVEPLALGRREPIEYPEGIHRA